MRPLSKDGMQVLFEVSPSNICATLPAKLEKSYQGNRPSSREQLKMTIEPTAGTLLQVKPIHPLLPHSDEVYRGETLVNLRYCIC